MFKIEYQELKVDRHLITDLPSSTILLIVCFFGSLVLIVVAVCIVCNKVGKRMGGFFDEIQGNNGDLGEDSELTDQDLPV